MDERQDGIWGEAVVLLVKRAEGGIQW